MHWKRWFGVLSGCVVFCGVLWGTGAQDAEAKGTHFLAEMNAGLGLPLGYEEGYDPGFGFGLTIGGGGKFVDNPTRFYLIGQFNTSSFTAEVDRNNRTAIIERQVTDLNAGVRLLWPVEKRVRVFTDFALGVAQVESEARIPVLSDRFVLRDTDSDFAVFTGAGLQFRAFYHVSFGMKGDFAFIFDEEEEDVVSQAALGPDSAQSTPSRLGRFNVYLTTTLHF